PSSQVSSPTFTQQVGVNSWISSYETAKTIHKITRNLLALEHSYCGLEARVMMFNSSSTTSPMKLGLSGREKLTPKSLRLSLVRAVTPRTVLPVGKRSTPLIVKGSAISFETPRMVKVPCAIKPLPFFSIRELLKVISGFFSTSKKSAVRRCLSRGSIPVSTLADLITAVTDDLVTSLSS